jgi:hypothetical protein
VTRSACVNHPATTKLTPANAAPGWLSSVEKITPTLALIDMTAAAFGALYGRGKFGWEWRNRSIAKPMSAKNIQFQTLPATNTAQHCEDIGVNDRHKCAHVYMRSQQSL